MPLPIERRPVDVAEAALGAFAMALGIAVALIARGFEGGSAYDVLGPRLMPFIIATGLVLTGLPILIGALRRKDGATREPIEVGPVLLVATALLVPILLLGTLGWIPVCALIFAIGARAFASRTPVRDLGLGLGLGVVSFIVFNYVLGLNLPVGSLAAGLTGG